MDLISIYFVLLVIGITVCQEVDETPKLFGFSSICARCICHAATGCNMTYGCQTGYCGPFKISKVYWKDAGEVVQSEFDDATRPGAYEDCTLRYSCALKTFGNYIKKYGRDCNGDGITDCEDFSMMHFNGNFLCSPPLTRNEFGKKWLERYEACFNIERETLLVPS